MGRSTSEMLENLAGIVTSVKAAADQVLSGSNEISFCSENKPGLY